MRCVLASFLAYALLAAGTASAEQQPPYTSVGQVSYFATPVPGEPPGKPPVNEPAPYVGEKLVLRSGDVGGFASEPTLGVARDGTAYYTTSAFDSVVPGLATTVIVRSRDGGATWQSVQPRIDDQNRYLFDLDPYVYVEEDSGRVFGVTLAGAGSFLSFSDTQGESWEYSAMSSPGANDHQTLFAAVPPEGTSLSSSDPAFSKLVYYCVNHVSDARCARSSDGGRTFTPQLGSAFAGAGPIQEFLDSNAEGENELVCSALHGHLQSDSSGVLFLPSGHCGWPDLAISRDGAATWERTRISSAIQTAGTQTVVAVDADDNVYYGWWDRETKLPYIAVSTDGGRSFGKPLMVAPPGVSAANFPVLVAGDRGRIAITFPGTASKDEDDEERPWDTWAAVSTNALDERPTFVAARATPPADPVHRGDCQGRCRGMFDFLDAVVSPADGSVWATAVDTCTDTDGCNNPKERGSASDSRGLVVRQLSGPWLRAKGRPGAAAFTAADAKLRCARRRGRAVRCTVTLPAAPEGSRASLVLKRGRTSARGTAGFRAGRAVVTARSRRALARGRYAAKVTLAVPGGARTTARRRLTLR